MTWIVPFAILASAGPRLAWGVLSVSVLASYGVLIPLVRDGVWSLPAWVPWVEWVPFYGVLAWEVARARRARAPEEERG